MQVFVPFPAPIDCARFLDTSRLHKQILECDQILKAISGVGGWINHPVVAMYRDYAKWLRFYRATLVNYPHNFIAAYEFSRKADKIRPPFLTDAFCDQHKRRLYTKAPEHYPQFADYGESDENWYVVDGVLLKYINGKQV